MNEWAGVGNHTTAKFWEWDTRIARRLNQDPKPHPSISNYAGMLDNPNLNSDVLGDIVRYSGNVPEKDANGATHVRRATAGELEQGKLSWEVMKGRLNYLGEGKNLADLEKFPTIYYVDCQGRVVLRSKPKRKGWNDSMGT